MKHDEWIKHPAATTFLKQLRKGALRALFLACLIPLAFVFLVLLLGACVSFAVLLVLCSKLNACFIRIPHTGLTEYAPC